MGGVALPGPREMADLRWGKEVRSPPWGYGTDMRAKGQDKNKQTETDR